MGGGNVKRILAVLLCLAFLLMLPGCRGLLELDLADILQANLPETEEEWLKVSGGLLSDRYAYGFLTEEQKRVYVKLLQGYLNQDATISGLRIPSEELFQIVEYLYWDYPGLFWVSSAGSSTYFDGMERSIAVNYTPTYLMDKEERLRAQEELETASRRFLVQANGCMDEYTKVSTIFKALILETEYDEDYMDEQSLYTVLTQGRGVCSGYAFAMQYLLNQLGIFCFYVGGQSQGEGHAWNLVRVDGEYYYLDATWGDVDGGDWEDAFQEIAYEYLCFDQQTLELFYTLDEETPPLPECTATAANYYARADLWWDSYDRDRFKKLVRGCLEREEHMVSIRLKTPEALQAVVDDLAESGGIYDLLEELVEESPELDFLDWDSFYYMADPDLLVYKQYFYY